MWFTSTVPDDTYCGPAIGSGTGRKVRCREWDTEEIDTLNLKHEASQSSLPTCRYRLLPDGSSYLRVSLLKRLSDRHERVKVSSCRVAIDSQLPT